MEDNTQQQPSSIDVKAIAQRLGMTTEQAIDTMKQALNIDEELKNAETQGYLRGRNEKIELTTHPLAHDEAELTATVNFPRYRHHSVWD